MPGGRKRTGCRCAACLRMPSRHLIERAMEIAVFRVVPYKDALASLDADRLTFAEQEHEPSNGRVPRFRRSA